MKDIQSFLLRLVVLCLPLIFVYPSYAADHLHAFIYHRFGDSRYPSTNVSLAEFSAQMRFLKENGYRVISALEACAYLKRREPLPSKTVILTVDDAYDTFKSGAMPILRQYGYPVTLFVNTACVGGAGYLNWDELRQLAAEGVEIGNHTASHTSLTARRASESDVQYRARLHSALDSAQKALQRELGLTPRLFAYPYGEFSRETLKIVEEFGFLAAFGQHSGVIGMQDNLFSLPRTPLTGSFATTGQMQQKLALRPMPVRIVAPEDTLITTENPPILTLEVLDPQFDLRRLRLFVNGQPGGSVRIDPQHANRIRVRGDSVLGQGRSKYVLTAPGRERGTFYGLTQFWLNRRS